MLGIGQWLDVNGEAIYGTRPWTRFGEGTAINNQPAYAGSDIHFTTRVTPQGGALYAILMAWPGEKALITSLGTEKVSRVELLASCPPTSLAVRIRAEDLRPEVEPLTTSDSSPIHVNAFPARARHKMQGVRAH